MQYMLTIRAVICWVGWGPLIKDRCYYRTLPDTRQKSRLQGCIENHRQGIINAVQTDFVEFRW